MTPRPLPHPHQAVLPWPVSQPPQALRDALKTELLTLSFHGFEACVQDLLHALGYTQVSLLERTAIRQRTGHGGHDLAAASETGVTQTRVLIQVKQYLRPVSRRFVDELAGCLARSAAEQGMIITTGIFSKAAVNAAQAHQVVPIRLVGGDELLDLLVAEQVGVKALGDGEGAEWQIDRTYFQSLYERYPRPPLLPQIRPLKAALVPHISLAAGGDVHLKGDPMLWRTHMLGGTSSLWLLAALPHGLSPDLTAPLMAAATLGALLPDLDAAEAKVKHVRIGQIEPFAPLSQLLHRTLGHRGFLHSLGGLGLVALFSLPLIFAGAWQCAAALVLGYASHLALDACTRSGIPLLIGKARRFYLLPARLRFVTGSPSEEIVVALLGSATLLLLLLELTHLSLS